MIVPDILLAEGDMIGDFVVLHTPGPHPGLHLPVLGKGPAALLRGHGLCRRVLRAL
jgi:hypothetical protein